jgi:hypothetical protein
VHLPLGQHTRYGEYTVWLTTPTLDMLNSDPKAQDLPFYDVRLTRTYLTGKFAGWHFYVDLNKELLNLNLSERNPLYAKVFLKKKPKEGEEEVKLTPEEADFQGEFQAYQWRKDMGMPSWRLSRRHLLDLFKLLNVMASAQ